MESDMYSYYGEALSSCQEYKHYLKDKFKYGYYKVKDFDTEKILCENLNLSENHNDTDPPL